MGSECKINKSESVIRTKGKWEFIKYVKNKIWRKKRIGTKLAIELLETKKIPKCLKFK